MKISLKDLKNNPHQELSGEVSQLDQVQKLLNNSLITKVLKITYDLKLDFSPSNSVLKIQGPIEFTLNVIDANDGKEFSYHQIVKWNDRYCFAENWQGNENFILGSEFDLLTYLAEEINLNIPLNLSRKHGIISKTGSGWELLSEADYQVQKEQNNDPDPRWEKLDQWKNK